jgi:glycosyltransferase involved in cell wall biosynthesis
MEQPVKVSVVTPVYNAAEFVRRAVESALEQEQTVQVVLVEDGSTDNSLAICSQLADQYPPVELVRHTAQKLLGSDTGIDGVYEAIGVHCQDDESRRKWSQKGDGELTTMFERIPPENLFDALIDYNMGNFTLDGLVVRKSSFWREDPFIDVRLHQDTAMIIQLAHYAKLVPGRLTEPVAIRGVHAGNRSLSTYRINRTSMCLWDILFKWSRKEKLPKKRIANIFRNALYFRFRACTGRCSSYRPDPVLLPGLMGRVACHPYLFILALKEHRRRRGIL